MRVADHKLIAQCTWTVPYQNHNVMGGVRLRGTFNISLPDNIKMSAPRGIKPIPFPLLSHGFIEVIIRFLKGINS